MSWKQRISNETLENIIFDKGEIFSCGYNSMWIGIEQTMYFNMDNDNAD